MYQEEPHFRALERVGVGESDAHVDRRNGGRMRYIGQGGERAIGTFEKCIS